VARLQENHDSLPEGSERRHAPGADRPRSDRPRPVPGRGSGGADNGGRRLTLTVAPSPAALSAVRQKVRVFLDGFAPEASVDDVVLCLHEACKNAIRFGGGRAIDVVVSLQGDEVRLVVRDHGVGFTPGWTGGAPLPGPLETQGRGLYLITALMDHVTVVSDHGTIIKMRRRLAP
jgi:anti-sigma regulatory factor (Ser/Thr protein kinase)